MITDVRMSWTSGIQALAMARTAGYRTPFVVITGHVDTVVRAAAGELGAQLLEKPFPIEDLLEAAELAIARATGAAAG